MALNWKYAKYARIGYEILGSTKSTVTYRVRCEALQERTNVWYKWGGRYDGTLHYLIDFGDATTIHWAAPGNENWYWPQYCSNQDWYWNGEGYVTGSIALAYQFWKSAHDTYTNYFCLRYVDTNGGETPSTRPYGPRTVTLDARATNERTRKKKVTIALYDTGGMGGSAVHEVTLEGKPLDNPSNIVFNVEVDPVTEANRFIRISLSYTNDENFYLASITGPNNSPLATGITSSFSTTIPVTSDMFNTERIYTLTIRGRDGIVYTTLPKSTGNILPSGVGVWYKQSGIPKGVSNVYYKKLNGDIVEVTELWSRRNSRNIRTIK